MSREFYETRSLFRSYVEYDHPYSYDEWSNLLDEHKVAVLYCQFFDEIILAWYKTKSFYASEQEGVETICQYLMKNVPVIESDPKRFTNKYIYRVAYNCLYCISHDRIRDKLEYELKVSNIVSTSEGDIDIFDTFISKNSEADYDIDNRLIEYEFWKTIDEDDDTRLMADYILTGKGISWRSKRRKAAIEKLREKLDKFKPYYYDE